MSERGCSVQVCDIKEELVSFISTLKTLTSTALRGNAFAGLSVQCLLFMDQLPTSTCRLSNASKVSECATAAKKLSLLVNCTAITAADAMSFRTDALASLLATFDIHPVWSFPTESPLPGLVFPAWTLKVQVHAPDCGLYCPICLFQMDCGSSYAADVPT
jgi:hypothetical protein